MYYIKQLFLLFTFVSLAGSSLWVNAQEGKEQKQWQSGENSDAQAKVSDEELKKFATIRKEMRKIRQEQMPKMVKAIEEAGLTAKRYKNLRQRLMGRGQKKNSARTQNESGKVSEKEKQQFEEAQKAVSKIKEETRKKQQKVVSQNGLTQKRFKGIYKALRSNRKLQKRLKQLQRSSGQNQGDLEDGDE